MAVLGNTSVISLTLLDGVIGNLNPKTTNVYTLGTSSLKWNNVYATTFTGNLTGNATISAANGFTYSGIGTASDNAARPIWFAYNGVNGRPVIDNDFKYNPANNTITIGTGSLNPTQYTGNAATSTSAVTADYPAGFSSRSTNATWGNQTGTTITCWNDSSGGSIDIRRNNPSSGKLSIKVDGRFYGNEGNNPAMLMKEANGYWGMGTPDAADNVWIRTTTLGIIPYQSGGSSGGHGGIGTSSWYFASSYIQNMYGNHIGNVTTASITHIDGGSVNNGTWVTGATGTAPTATTTDGTTTYSGAVVGTSILTLGNNKVGANSASGVANNSQGYLRLYSSGSAYGELTGYSTSARTHVHATTGLSFPENIIDIMFRPGNSSYYTHISYQTSGNEALVSATQNSVTSFIFVNGESYANVASDRWTKLTGASGAGNAPGLQIKQNCVSIGELIPSGTNATYKLNVNGTSNFKNTMNITNASINMTKAGEIGIEVDNTQSTNPNKVAFIVGSSGNGGIYSRKHNKWIVYVDASGNVVLNGNANTATKWASAQKVYVTLGTASTTTTIQGGSTSAQTIGVDGTLGVAHGGTGATSFAVNSVIMSGSSTTAALTTRTVTNNTSNTAIAANTNIPTMNTIYYGLAVINNASQTRGVSIYAPTTGGTADTQALVGNGTTTAPKWVNIGPDITITAGTGSATPKINVTVLGQSGSAESITAASTSVYGCTKLQDGVSSQSTALAATANAAYTASRNVLQTGATTAGTFPILYKNTANVVNETAQVKYNNVALTDGKATTLNPNTGEMAIGKLKVFQKVTLEYNATDDSLDFVWA